MGIRKVGIEDGFECRECDGTGQAVHDCEACQGNGWVEDEEDGGTMTCPECFDDKCDRCNGTGERTPTTGGSSDGR